MKCKECNGKIEDDLKYVAYISDNKAVYWKICDKCLKRQWQEFMKDFKRNG